MKTQGYIKDYKIEKIDNVKSNIVIDLKYVSRERVIGGIKRISKPGLRVYTNYEDIPRVLNGNGISIISTSKGITTGDEARKMKIGGEVLAFVW